MHLAIAIYLLIGIGAAIRNDGRIQEESDVSSRLLTAVALISIWPTLIGVILARLV